MEKNPYDRGNGMPVAGKESEFFSWAREHEMNRRKDLPKAEQKVLQESDDHLAQKMNS